jgi:hypothetical protein
MSLYVFWDIIIFKSPTSRIKTLRRANILNGIDISIAHGRIVFKASANLTNPIAGFFLEQVRRNHPVKFRSMQKLLEGRHTNMITPQHLHFFLYNNKSTAVRLYEA